MKFTVKITLPDGTESKCKVGRKVQTWDDAGHAEAHALKVRDSSPRGTRTKVVIAK